MTLALYGKSRRRQGALITAALLAVIIATVGALSAITSAFAHSASVSGTAKCTADGWSVEWKIKGDTTSKQMHITSFTVTGGGTTTSPTPNPVPQGTSPQEATAQTTGIPLTVSSVTATARVYWDKNDGSQRYPSQGTNEYKKTVNKPSNCDRTIRIVKVTEGSGAPNTWSFSGTITNATPNTWTITNSTSNSRVDFTVPKNQTHTVAEDTPSGGWSLVGYRVLSGKKSANDCGTKDSEYDDSPSIGAGTGDVTVCVLNEFDKKVGGLVLSSSACVLVNNVQYAQFHFLIPNNQGVNQGAGGTLSGTYNDGANKNFGPINEDTTPNNGHPDWTFTLPFGTGSSVQLLSAQTSTGWTWGQQGRDKDTVNKSSCQPVIGEPGVSKVPLTPAYSNGYAYWNITIDNSANAGAVEVHITDTDVQLAGALPSGCNGAIDTGVTCTVSAQSQLSIPVKRQVEQQCREGKAENTAVVKWRVPNSQQWSAEIQAKSSTITIPADESKCALPTIKKWPLSIDSEVSDPNVVAWLIRVDNPNGTNGTQRTVYIKDANVTVDFGPTYTGGATCTIPSDSSFQAELTGTNGVECTMPPGSNIFFKVKPNPAPKRACEPQQFTNTAYLLDANGNELAKAEGSPITLKGDPSLCTREVTICKVLENNNDGVIRTGTFSFDVRIGDGSQVTETKQVSLSNVTEGGDKVCAKVEVPTNQQFQVVEGTSRPAGWNGDESGYPKYAVPNFDGYSTPKSNDTTDWFPGSASIAIEITFYNKEKLPEIKVRFQKVICDSFSDVAINQGDGLHDTGKPVFPGGGLHGLLNQTPAPAGDNDIVTPSNDGRSQNCHIWGDGQDETGNWNFYLKSKDGSSTLATIAHPSTADYGEHTLTAAELQLALQANTLRVEEELRNGYAFAGLKCWKDHLNQDNWEWIDFSKGLPGPDDTVWCIAYNVPFKKIELNKIFYGVNAVTEADYPTFTIPSLPWWDMGLACTGPGTSGSGTAVSPIFGTWTCWVPQSWVPNGEDIVETPAEGWEQCEILGQTDGEGNGDADPFSFANCKKSTIIVKKVVTNVVDDTTQFTVTLSDGSQSSQTGQIAESSSSGPVNATFNNVSPNTSYTITEQPQNGYQVLGWALASGEACPEGPIDVRLTNLTIQGNGAIDGNDNTAEVIVAPGATVVVCFYNERFGNVVVDKQVSTNTATPGVPFTWTITVNVAGGPTSSALTLSDTLPAGFTYGSPSATSPLSCTLSSDTLECTLPQNTPIGTYTVTIQATAPTNNFEICGEHTNTVSFSGAGTEGTDSATVTVGCVASDGTILVRKVVVGQPGDTTTFTANLTGPGISGTATEPFSQQAPGIFAGLAAGTFTVSEQSPTGYQYLGWAYGTIVGSQVQCPAQPTNNAASTNVTLTTTSPRAAVCFYNEARVTIRVKKVLNVVGFTNPGANWQFTLTGCGITPQTKTTDANGVAEFTDLPPAIGCQYTVTETVQAGWTPQFVSQTAAPTQGGQVVELTFLNIRVFDPPCVDPNDARCQPPVTTTPPTTPPTMTTPPTTPPTNPPTTVTPPTNTPTNTPTPVETVAGERTPGPGESPTPLAPATGFGFGGGAGGANLLLVLAGLLSLSLGLAFLALGRRTNR